MNRPTRDEGIPAMEPAILSERRDGALLARERALAFPFGCRIHSKIVVSSLLLFRGRSLS